MRGMKLFGGAAFAGVLTGCGSADPTAAITVQHEDVTVGGYQCGNNHNARVYYPAPSDDKVPIISFAHGYNAGKTDAYTDYGAMLTDIAAAGYVVIVSESSAYPFECPSEWKDQMASIVWARTSKFASKIDFTKAGIIGHSMGGGATYHLAGIASAVKDLSIGAAVALHPEITCPLPIQPVTNPLVPILFGSGSEDYVVFPSCVKSEYDKVTGVPKAFAEVAGAAHDEPMNDPWGKRRLTPYAIAMFDCHLKGDTSQCSKVYGKGAGSLCSGAVSMTKCEHANEPSSDNVVVV